MDDIDKIINIFKMYCVEYDRYYKIIYIREAIPVKDFVFLKYVLKNYRYKINDIRVVRGCYV